MWYSSQTTLDTLVDAGLLDNFSHGFINYGLHVVSIYTRDRFQVHLTARLERLAASRGRMATPRNIVYVGPEAEQEASRLDLVRIAQENGGIFGGQRTTARVNNIPFIDTYTTLPMLEFNADGVHYDERVTRALAMLLASVMTGVKAVQREHRASGTRVRLWPIVDSMFTAPHWPRLEVGTTDTKLTQYETYTIHVMHACGGHVNNPQPPSDIQVIGWAQAGKRRV